MEQIINETGDAFLSGWDADHSDPENAPAAASTPAVTAAETSPDTNQPFADATLADDDPLGDALSGDNDLPDDGDDEAPGRLWQLKHLDEIRSVDEDELIALAQKGLDYDRIRTGYDAAKPVMELASVRAGRMGMTVPEYVDFARQAELDPAGDDEIARREADLDSFAHHFPDAASDPDSIPEEVWQAVREGSSLSLAYALHALNEARDRAGEAISQSRALVRDRRNAARSTGSMRSSGADRLGKDPFLEGWDE